MLLGFACAWERPPEPTWSYTPWNLRAALRGSAGSGDEVRDVGVNYPRALRLALKASCARRHGRRWVSMWRHSRAARGYGAAVLRRAARRDGCDLVLQVQDLAVVDRPYLLVQDLSYDVLLEHGAATGELEHFPTLSRDAVLRLRDRQRAVYARAAGVLAMSQWFADHLVAVSGVPRDRVHVVNPGASALAGMSPEPAVRDRPRRRLLFVGKDFHAKGGDQVLAALAVLRRDVDPAVTLTVVGPRDWPLPGEPPAGVRFAGRLPVAQLSALYAEHDLFVMPSRFEGFGIAFVEALAHGLPCVARQAFAMPEIVRPGHNGTLVSTDDPGELATTVAELLADDAVFASTAAAAPEVARHYTWSRAAEQVWSVARQVA